MLNLTMDVIIKEGINKKRISPEAINYSIEKILDNFKLIKNGRQLSDPLSERTILPVSGGRDTISSLTI